MSLPKDLLHPPHLFHGLLSVVFSKIIERIREWEVLGPHHVNLRGGIEFLLRRRLELATYFLPNCCRVVEQLELHRRFEYEI